MKEMPAFESRRVRTQPLTVVCDSFAARPARMSRTLRGVFSMCVLLPRAAYRGSAQWSAMLYAYADLRRRARFYWYRADKAAWLFTAFAAVVLAGLVAAMQAVFGYQDARRLRERALHAESL